MIFMNIKNHGKRKKTSLNVGYNYIMTSYFVINLIVKAKQDSNMNLV